MRALRTVSRPAYSSDQVGASVVVSRIDSAASRPASAVLSAIIFNALIIVALIPLALRGVRYRAVGAAGLLRRNLLIYGLGGLIAPFIGIKLIDLVVAGLGLA